MPRTPQFERAKAAAPDIKFKLGDRVGLTELGKLSFSKSPLRRGTVVAVAVTHTKYRVRWDGQKTAEYVHWTYLALDDEDPGKRS